jgi:hypothetical protein
MTDTLHERCLRIAFAVHQAINSEACDNAPDLFGKCESCQVIVTAMEKLVREERDRALDQLEQLVLASFDNESIDSGRIPLAHIRKAIADMKGTGR